KRKPGVSSVENVPATRSRSGTNTVRSYSLRSERAIRSALTATPPHDRPNCGAIKKRDGRFTYAPTFSDSLKHRQRRLADLKRLLLELSIKTLDPGAAD